MAYTVIKKSPQLLNSASKAELREYFDWFMSAIPQRIEELAAAVRAQDNCSAWTPDLSLRSLQTLGEWFAINVETRPRSSDELKRIAGNVPPSVFIPREELTDRTFSLASDIGMYLGQVFRNEFQNLEWTIFLSDKKSMYYGHVGLTNFRPKVFSPVHVVEVLAYSIANKEKKGGALLELYGVWSKFCS